MNIKGPKTRYLTLPGFLMLVVIAYILSEILFEQLEASLGEEDDSDTVKQDVLLNNSVPAYIAVPLPNNTVYINSAIFGNSTPSSSWDILLLTVWSKPISKGYCCALFEDGTIISITMSNVTDTKYVFDVKSRLLHCKIPRKVRLRRQFPVAASFAHKGNACSTNRSHYYPVDVVYKQRPGSIGVCTKKAYGTIDAKTIIEWFEIHKYLGIDKVYTQVYPTLNEEARKVLAYYESTGILTTKRYELPDPVYEPVTLKNHRTWNNNALIVLDCAEHLRGYTYVTVYDYDEFLIPRKHMSWKDMLSDLFSTQTKAAGFTFETAIYFTDTAKTHSENPLLVTQFLNRTKPFLDRPKVFSLMDRVMIGQTRTHSITPVPGYESVTCPPEIGFIRHYRRCRPQWNVSTVPVNDNRDLCWNIEKRVKDTTMLEVAAIVQDNVLKMRRKILGE